MSHVYPNWSVTWVDVGREYYKVISEHGSTLGLDGRCVGHDFVDFLCVSYTYVYVFVASMLCFPLWKWCCHWRDDDVVVNMLSCVYE